MDKLLVWLLNGVVPGVVTAIIIGIAALSFGLIERWMEGAAVSAFPEGTIILVSKNTKSCPDEWELLGEVSILGWDPDPNDQAWVGRVGGVTLDDYGERRDADQWGYSFDYFRFFACGKTR